MRSVKMEKYNAHSGVLYDVPGYHIGQVAKKKAPPTDSQTELIAKLRKKLEEAGIETSYLKEPETKEDASLLIRSLTNISKKKGVYKGSGEK